MPWTLSEIHPLFVHFPIALFSTGLLFDVLAQLLNIDDLETAGFWIMLIALVSSLFTIISGIIAFVQIGSFIDLLHFHHGLLQLTATLILFILFTVRIQLQIDFRYSILKRNIYFAFHIIAVCILFYSAHLGAKAAGRI